MLEQTAKGGDRQVLEYVTDLLNKNVNVGFLINERFINIPAQVGYLKACAAIYIYIPTSTSILLYMS
jgi:hypothetical protein